MKPLLLLPIIVFVVLGGFALRGLFTVNPLEDPLALEGQVVPEFQLVDMPGLGTAFTKEDLVGQVTLVNVFGSWCAACHIEHPVLVDIHKSGIVPLYGINWADTPQRGADWLARYGNSYTMVGNDEAGRAVIAFGVTGAPETFVIDKEGRIRYRHQGAVTPAIWRETLLPMVRQLQEAA